MAFHPQPLFFLVLGLVAGTLAPLAEVSAAVFVALGLAAFLSIAAVARPALVPLSALIVAAFGAGSGLAAGARVNYERQALPQALRNITESVVVEGRVVSDSRLVNDQIRFEVESRRIVAQGREIDYQGRIRVFVRRSEDEPLRSRRVEAGDEIRAWVDLRHPEPVRTPGGFDEFAWARRQGLHAFATCKSERLLQVTGKSPHRRPLVARARFRLKDSWRHVRDPLDRAVTASMVLGDDDALDPSTRDEFRAAGLLHILVVSGAQVAALIIGLRRALPASLRIAWTGCLLECAVLIAYCLLAGAENSIVRATAMAMAFAVAVRVDLNRGGANFLAAAALVLLAARPLDALDPGAQMSFAATLALVTFAGPFARRLEAARVPGLLADVAAATLVATVAVSPLTLLHFHRFSLTGLPANLVAAPLAVLLLYGSLTTAFLDAIFVPAASAAGWLCGYAAEGLRFVAHEAAKADPDWRGPGPPLVLLLGLAGAFGGSGWRRVAAPMAGLLAALTMSGLPRADGRLHVWFLDVGQGDAMVIETPNGHVGVIDAGPSFETFDAGERVVAEALFELGYRRLDFLAVTHRHADHEGGAPFLARHFAPARLYVNGPSSPLKAFEATAVGGGDLWLLDGILFRILGPYEAWPLPQRDENARSLVIEMRYAATSFLLMGDASVRTERLVKIPEGGYDLVKVGHHGALTSSSERLVARTRPLVAVISVGSRNRFSHPSPTVVKRWSGGALVWRTDRDRTLQVTSDGRSIVW
ncbi:MAG: ComEC/Rec2 family competence protein [Vicinamibacteria bacterium]|nr:ComEC/Rec2 family competence protein [Vicinamibacteria bacterium]